MDSAPPAGRSSLEELFCCLIGKGQHPVQRPPEYLSKQADLLRQGNVYIKKRTRDADKDAEKPRSPPNSAPTKESVSDFTMKINSTPPKDKPSPSAGKETSSNEGGQLRMQEKVSLHEGPNF
jgi:hypothetical protein